MVDKGGGELWWKKVVVKKGGEEWWWSKVVVEKGEGVR